MRTNHIEGACVSLRAALRTAVAVVVLTVVLAACGESGGSSTSPAAPGGASSPASGAGEAQGKAAEVTAEVVHTYFAEEPFEMLRFLVEVRNEGDAPRGGIVGTWTAYDADGTIIGHHDGRPLPPIPAGGVIRYVGGAGGAFLSGNPAAVTFELVNEGRALQEMPASSVQLVGEPTFTPHEDWLTDPGEDAYEVAFTVEALADVVRDDLYSAVSLVDDAGKVLGIAWADFDSAPARLSEGARFKGEVWSVPVPSSDGPPVAVEVFLWGS